mgnify:CR=1 FL=1
MSFENMVPFSCLTEDFPRIEQLLRTYQEVIIIRGDQPRYRLTEIPAADSAAGTLPLPTEAEDEPSRPRRLSVQEKTVLRRKLDSIGKSVFVRYSKPGGPPNFYGGGLHRAVQAGPSFLRRVSLPDGLGAPRPPVHRGQRAHRARCPGQGAGTSVKHLKPNYSLTYKLVSLGRYMENFAPNPGRENTFK